MAKIFKTVLMMQSSIPHGQIWKKAFANQGITLIWQKADFDLAEYLWQCEKNDQPFPDLILLEIGTGGVANPKQICSWCNNRYPQVKIALTQSEQAAISSIERENAISQGAQDLLPSVHSATSKNGMNSNVKTILDLLEISHPPETLIRTQRPGTILAEPSKLSLTTVQWIGLGLLLFFGLSVIIRGLFSSSLITPEASTQTAPSITLISTLRSHNGPVFSLAISPDGNTFVSGSKDRTIKRWNLKTGKLLHTFFGHLGPVVSVAISSNGDTLVSGSLDKTVRVWDVEMGTLISTLTGGEKWVKAVAISPNSRTIASGNEDRIITFWQLKPEKFLRTLFAHQESIEAIAFSSNGALFASSGEDTSIKLWDKTGQLIRTLQGHRNPPEAIAFTPDAQTLIGGDNVELRQWNVSTGKVIRIFPQPSGSVQSITIDQKGKLLVSGHADHTIKVWSLKTGEHLRTFTAHQDGVLSVALTPDGNTLISSSRDKTIKLWRFQSAEPP
jgi:WD40 repeat protein